MSINKQYSDKAHAKINLYLDVISKRNDGFHNIKSIMQSVSLYDRIDLMITEHENDILTCNVPGIPTDEGNLAIKAVNAFRESLGLDFGVKLHLEKNIPSAAGLGGGSSDAAAVLRLLKLAVGADISDNKMIKIAERVGADVPFCLFGGTMLASGKGEELSRLSVCPKLYLVVAIKGEGVSTPWAYSRLDEQFGDFGGIRDEGRLDNLLNALTNHDSKGVVSNLYNIFEAVVEGERPMVSHIKETLLACGSSAVLMSGSGPSVLGFFDEKGQALAAVDALRCEGAKAYFCTT
ncbi:MAG: 4-(cytidine 5'-diphospho)-2-C-methyl-D-erythritol kinase [Clostridia bacterium]|nr:4-(cytidine 5'-diphospho)-2-C-methyl-D-erythritol kinase [Clostridia bacterium]